MDFQAIFSGVLSFAVSFGDELVGGVMAIICAVIGARMATRSSKAQEWHKSLQDAYADVFARYFACMVENSDENALAFITAEERLRLICSSESEQIIEESIPILAEDNPDLEKLGACIQKLRKSAKEDLEHYQRKKR